MKRRRGPSWRARFRTPIGRKTTGNIGIALGLSASLLSVQARADGPIGNNGARIQTSEYAVDLHQGTISSGSRIIGLSGAYVAIAEGVAGSPQTPAAVAHRKPHSTGHFDFDFGLGVTFPSTLRNTDYFNTGRDSTRLRDADQQDAVFFSPALTLQWGRFGVGVSSEIQTYSLKETNVGDLNRQQDELKAQFFVTHAQIAHGFADGQLLLGVGLRLISLDVTHTGTSSNGEQRDTLLFSTSGLGTELGALWRPNGKQYRVGLAFRSSVDTAATNLGSMAPLDNGDRIVPSNASANLDDPTALAAVLNNESTIWLPERASLPWDLNAGFALQLGARPLNPRWEDPEDTLDILQQELKRRAVQRQRLRRRELERGIANGQDPEDLARALDAELERETAVDELKLERVARETTARLRLRYEKMRRSYLMVSMALLVTGRVRDAVGIESFLQRVVDRSGELVVLSPRLGVEAEPVPNLTRVRAGTYGEPSRFSRGAPRLHGTVGFDQRLFRWTLFGLFDPNTHWRLSAALDAAPRYLGWSAGLGIWH